MQARVHRRELGRARLRLIAAGESQSTLYVPVEDVVDLLAMLMPALTPAAWRRIVRRSVRAGPAHLRQRAMVDGRIEPTVEAALLQRLCENLASRVRRDARLAQMARGQQRLTGFVYDSLASVRRSALPAAKS